MLIRSLLLVAAISAAAPVAAQSAFAAPALDDGLLGAIAGRADTTMMARAEQTSTVAGNSVGDNVATGDVRIDAQAFQNLQGLAVLSINTGNNVSFNSAMNVTIAINPGL